MTTDKGGGPTGGPIRGTTGGRTGAIAGVILAGGRAARLGGRRKGLLRIGGRTLIARLLEVYAQFFDEVVIAARETGPYARFGVPVAPDAFARHSSLSGIHAGLSAVRAEHAFVAACDAPFLRPGVVARLLAAVTDQADVVVPLKADGWMEPLCAVYSRRCLGPIAAQLAGGDCKIVRFFPQVRVVQVPESELRGADPDLASFVNVNTPAEVRRAVLAARVTRP
ncbi:MAG: molybdenum cofactor guanylyltransferase [Desulfovibrionaceae bacterium]|jgi:molybdopterin-guanine dinucleotide biosynthesis protein A|nr:molybdenum cofactor guanylyltransferase [Desulfovibrionaceae bacterium]